MYLKNHLMLASKGFRGFLSLSFTQKRSSWLLWWWKKTATLWQLLDFLSFGLIPRSFFSSLVCREDGTKVCREVTTSLSMEFSCSPAGDANDPRCRNSLPVIFYDLMRALRAITCDISFPQQRFWSGSWPRCHLDLYLQVGKRGGAYKVFVVDCDLFIYLIIYLFYAHSSKHLHNGADWL